MRHLTCFVRRVYSVLCTVPRVPGFCRRQPLPCGHLVDGHQYTFVTAFLHLLIFSPFTSPSFFLPTTTMLTSITSSLRPTFSLATRALATTNVVRQQPNYSEVWSTIVRAFYLCAASGWRRASVPAFQCAEQENGRRRHPFHLHPRAGWAAPQQLGERCHFFVRQDMFRESVRKFMQDTLAPQQVHSFSQ